ncbi:MAG: c-type cytochrome [Xanthomonadales bacterium]|nr:c-type cytochrome [Xanthomonadales bacterium]
MRVWLQCAWVIAACGMAQSVYAATVTAAHVPNTLQQRIAACSGCHGQHGEGGDNGFNPRIAGKPALYLYRQLLNFRAGRRSYPPMEYMVRLLPDAYLREIADYFSAQHPPHLPSQVSVLPSAVLARGQQLVRHGDAQQKLPACEACHGKSLAGVLPAVPALIGLPYDYISAQLGAWRTQTRKAIAPDCMATIASRLSPADISAVAAWLSAQALPARLSPQAAGTTHMPLSCGSAQP